MSESNIEQQWRLSADPTIEEFGPCRAIGMSYAGKNENNEIPALWCHGFLPRKHEIVSSEPCRGSFGICRCLPEATDGSFEYIAAIWVGADVLVPDGMIEIAIPRARYVIFTVRNLGEIHQVWEYSRQWFAAHPEWQGYCGPDGCECAQYPGFEYYPPNFDDTKPLFIYFPVRSRD